MNLGLEGKIALVFGASSGIGRGIAQVLSREGAKTILAARREKELEQASREIGAAHWIRCDLSKPESARKAVEEVEKKFGAVDILVTNAGGPPKGDFEKITDEKWREGFQTLWLSAVEAVQAALPGMRSREYGRVILITSTAAREPIPHLTVSNGLRAGLLGLMKSLSHEVASSNITVNAILPGYTRTERLAELGVSESDLTKHIPAKRLGTVEDLGALAAFLASKQAGYLTGQAIALDGGILRGI